MMNESIDKIGFYIGTDAAITHSGIVYLYNKKKNSLEKV